MVWYGTGMALVWHWYGTGMALVWHWYGTGMVWYRNKTSKAVLLAEGEEEARGDSEEENDEELSQSLTRHEPRERMIEKTRNHILRDCDEGVHII
jgi:hypothetical protein